MDNIIKTIRDNHKKWASSFTWTPPLKAYQRRNMEQRFYNENPDYTFLLKNGDVISCKFVLEVSCKNIYYSGKFYLNSKKKTLRCLKESLEIDSYFNSKGESLQGKMWKSEFGNMAENTVWCDKQNIKSLIFGKKVENILGK